MHRTPLRSGDPQPTRNATSVKSVPLGSVATSPVARRCKRDRLRLDRLNIFYFIICGLLENAPVADDDDVRYGQNRDRRG